MVQGQIYDRRSNDTGTLDYISRTAATPTIGKYGVHTSTSYNKKL